ncbi:hypothetical protein BDV96DRAFT_617855 [Lophiotrema nucula]|uniref:FAD/NAD(P)-binding domain-containing protein n=1 Tax=Lophiotrema nucula TaxID=690887 RepID=A0A6A5YGI9_9PLEO|nr:hypothetical protein BDV96DRAFT_617855 [Lophiotrema nucula]
MGSIEILQPEYDVLIIGAGLSGCYALHRMQKLNLKVRVLETGSSVGGTWYWNRYAGARFDCESYSYGFFWCQEVLDEWKWSEHFAPHEDTERYIKFICDKYQLWGNMQFNTRVSKAHWMTNDRRLLSDPTLPNIPGVHDFKGAAFHISRWPKDAASFEGKNVGIIGRVAKTAKRLTVFQRTPNWAIPLHNPEIGEEEMEAIGKAYPETLEQINTSRLSFLHQGSNESIWDATPEEREAFWEYPYAQPGFGFWISNYKETQVDRKANALVSEFVAKKIRQRVKDPWTADKRIPKTYGLFNRPKIRLVNLLETPIERIEGNGVKTSQEDIKLDMLIYATGFPRVITGAFDAIDIRGIDSIRLRDKWTDGPQTYLGLTVHDFPNLFMSIGPHQAHGNIPASIEYAVGWIADCIEYLQDHNITYLEAKERGVREWTEHVHSLGERLLSNEVDSWLTGVNKNVAGKQKRIIARCSGAAPDFRKQCNAVADSQYSTLTLE